MRAADHIITIAESMRDDIVARGVQQERVTVIPNGVNAGVAPLPPDPMLRQRYGIDAAVRVRLRVQPGPSARPGVAGRASCAAAGAGRRVGCLVRGDRHQRGENEAVAAGGVGGAVVFTGRVPHDQVRSRCALLDAFVVPRQ